MDDYLLLLIVDQNDEHFEFTERAVRNAGVKSEVIRFTDGQAILDFLSAAQITGSQFDMAYIVLLDVNASKVNGVEVLRRIKQNVELRHIPIIMTTTLAAPHEVSLCNELGCEAFLTKPVNGKKFSAVVKKLGIKLQA